MKKYELIYEFTHCLGKVAHSAGFVETKKEAQEWVKRAAREPEKYVDITARECLVEHCHLKTQKPVFSFRETEVRV